MPGQRPEPNLKGMTRLEEVTLAKRLRHRFMRHILNSMTGDALRQPSGQGGHTSGIKLRRGIGFPAQSLRKQAAAFIAHCIWDRVFHGVVCVISLSPQALLPSTLSFGNEAPAQFACLYTCPLLCWDLLCISCSRAIGSLTTRSRAGCRADSLDANESRRRGIGWCCIACLQLACRISDDGARRPVDQVPGDLDAGAHVSRQQRPAKHTQREIRRAAGTLKQLLRQKTRAQQRIEPQCVFDPVTETVAVRISPLIHAAQVGTVAFTARGVVGADGPRNVGMILHPCLAADGMDTVRAADTVTAMVTGTVAALSRVKATSPATEAMRKSPVMAGTWAR